MNTMYIKINRIFVLLAMIGLISSCNKEEFMPPVVGEAIPYEEQATMTIDEALAGSGNTLFYQAWQRSSANTLLNYKGYPTNGFTVLVPSNEALEAKGWTEKTIEATATERLDTLVLEHVFLGAISQKDLSDRLDSYVATNVIEYRNYNYFEGKNISSGGVLLTTGREVWPYRYRAYLNRRDSQLHVNGNMVGNEAPIVARNGMLWPINTVMERPLKTAIQVLREDPRFSIYVELMDRAEQGKLQIINSVSGASLTMDNPKFISYVQRLGYGTIPAHPFSRTLFSYSNPVIGTLSTWFIPTNEAFRKAGFGSADEVWALNDRNGPPTVVVPWNNPTGNIAYDIYYTRQYATDTLLNYHHDWGRLYAKRREKTYRNGIPNITVFYTQDMDNTITSNYMMNGLYHEFSDNPTTGNAEDKEYFYFMPFEFQHSGNTVSLRIKNSGNPYVPIANGNIPTMNGPIHAVDDLILPSGFSLNR